MHLSESILRSHLDHELSDEETASTSDHLRQCATCSDQLESLKQNAERVRSLLSAAAPDNVPDPQTALKRFEAQKLSAPRGFPERLISPRMRPAFVALGAVALVVVALNLKPVRVWATEFLSMFRIQQIAVVQIDPTNLKQLQGDLFNSEMSTRMEKMLSDTVHVVKHGEPVEADSISDAVRAAGFGIRLPSSLSNPQFHVQPAADISFSVDVQRMQSILDDIGRSDVRLPEEIDGQMVYLNISASVLSTYGNCPKRTEMENAQEDRRQEHINYPDCKVLAQLPSPTVVAPPELNVPELAKTMLQLLGMSPEQAKKFSEQIDWASTLVIPMPVDGRMQFEEVEVDGVKGTLFTSHEYGPKMPAAYNLMWVRDGILYALMGQGNSQDAVTIANSMR